MAWRQLSFNTDSAQLAERLSDCLHDHGALAVTLRDNGDSPLFEPGPGEQPLWRTIQVQGLFEASLVVDSLLAQLRRELAPNDLPEYRLDTIEDQDWERAWLDDFKPMQFGKRLWIIPSAYAETEGEAINIRLDPGLAFGTGTHPTTALCLEWLDEYLKPGQSLIDYGCGSGILAIAAAKLGASHVWAVDIDPQALQATRENARANKVLDRVDSRGVDDFTPPRVDVLMANILANPLQGLAPVFAELVKPEGRIALSGVLKEQAELVRAAYQPWFIMAEPVERDAWVLLMGERLPI